ncbi:MAG: VOC family protein [Myxococcales bacterium]|nr:VOC family protein [Myxococcales bacterium]
MGNPIQHVEWRTRDAARLRAFYSSVFDWQFEDVQMGPMTYIVMRTGDAGGGGIYAIPEGDNAPAGIVNYATVADLGPHEEKITAGGGTVMMSNMEVPGVGWFTVFTDPDGNPFALWKQSPQAAPPVATKAAAAKPKKAAKAVKKAAKKEAKAVKKATKGTKKAAKKATKKAAKKAAKPVKKAAKPAKKARKK